jgi:cation diffusion facilitator family transporter
MVRMPATALQADLHAMQSEKRRVALNSVFAAFVITGLKGIVGVTTGSLGILSEAAHSALDLLAAVITFFSVRVSDQPADAEHQYGHGKVENFSAFLETGLLLLTCIWIVWEAVKRLAFQDVHIQATPAAFAVLLFSMAVDAWRSRRLGRIAVKYDSQALEADALHFSTDIWSSGVVVLGLALVWAGDHYGLPWLHKADPLAALVVAGVVVHVSWRLARQTIDALLDAAPKGVRGEILESVGRVQGVMEVDRVRIRRAGNKYFADVGVALSRRLTFQRSEQVAAEVTAAVQHVLPHSDVTVFSIPRASGKENIFDRIRAVALRHDFTVHDVSVQDLDGGLLVEQHLELDERLTLKQAHDIVTRIEAEIRAEVPEIQSILTHIESELATIEPGDAIVRDPSLVERLRAAARDFPEILDMHEVVLKRIRGLLYLSCHCTLADDTPLAAVHDLSTRLEIRFRKEAPELFKVLIHTEPQSDNRR